MLEYGAVLHMWCGDKTFYSLPCKKDKESEGEEKAIYSGEYVV